MTKIILVSGGFAAHAATLLAKSQVAAYTRKDGVTVTAHDSGKMAAAPKPASGVHPKGFGAGQTVFVKHPETGKKTIAKYQGAKDGKSVVQHDKLGTLHVDHEHVTPARGVPNRADPAASRAAGDHVREVMASNKTGSAAPAKPDWKSAHEEAEGELATASYRGGSKEKAVAALKKAADLHRAAAKRQGPGDMSPEHHNHYADKLSALAKDHGGGD